ncbi:MAG: cytochrome c [Thermoanaerobaculia bacterium]|nr:cytochrome c [Thermoanaerobaculia bacterium]
MARFRLTAVAAVLFLILGSIAPTFASDAAATFKSKCAACHGVDGSGNTPMGKKLTLAPLGSPKVQQQSDAVLLEALTKGKGKMPAYGGKLPDPDLKALVAHVRSFAKK